jgi:hypothetical protein
MWSLQQVGYHYPQNHLHCHPKQIVETSGPLNVADQKFSVQQQSCKIVKPSIEVALSTFKFLP